MPRLVDRHCQHVGCHNRIRKSQRADTKYCSQSCREKAWYARRRAEIRARKNATALARLQKGTP